jgi:hypothetical protein
MAGGFTIREGDPKGWSTVLVAALGQGVTIMHSGFTRHNLDKI